VLQQRPITPEIRPRRRKAYVSEFSDIERDDVTVPED